jgi:hypothetical protein
MERSAGQKFCLGSRELFVAQHALGVQGGELLQLGRHVISRRGRRRGRGCILRRRRRILWLLLRLGIHGALLVGLVVLLLGSRILLRIFLLLVVLDRTCRTGNHCRANRHAGDTSSYYSSSHHVDLFSLCRFRLGFY